MMSPLGKQYEPYVIVPVQCHRIHTSPSKNKLNIAGFEPTTMATPPSTTPDIDATNSATDIYIYGMSQLRSW